MLDISPTDLAYIAGFIDGEGSIGIYKIKASWGVSACLTVAIANTNRDVLVWIQCLVGGSLTQKPVYSEKHRPYWQLSISTRQAEGLLKAILPWLRIKKKQAEIALKYRKTFVKTSYGRGHRIAPEVQEERVRFINEIRKLNCRGVPVVSV